MQLALTERHSFHTAVQVYKIVKEISPSYLYDTFSFAMDVTGYSGSNVHRLFFPRVKTNYDKQSLTYRGTVIWNRLSSLLYGAKTLKEFKALYCRIL